MSYTVAPRTIASIYNPDLLTKEQLIASFVVRLNKFKKLFADIKEAKMEHPEQPILIVGLRGMGKTTLLLRLSYEVENDPDLNAWLLPLVFNEEEYGITKLFKLWETIAQYLEKKDSRFAGLFDRMDKEYERLKNDLKYEQAAFDLLLDALHQQGKKLLLLIDNFGDMFKRFGKQEKQRLREVLMTCPDLRIIAGSSVAAESFFDYGDPLYELFKIERLDGLTKEETEVLLLELGKSYPGNPIKEILEKQPQRVEALRRLTGGIPRSMVLLFEIFVDDKDGDAFTDLESVLDRVTPLYKHRMDDLPPQQQEIVNAIALNWDAVSAKEIAQKTRLDSKLVSAQLKQLHQNNIVDVQATHIKNHLYLVHDRFFNIWYLMRMARKGDKNRVLWLIRFLEAWCDEEQLSKRAGSLRKAMLKGTYHPKGAYDFSTALYHAEKHDLDSRYELAKQTQRFMEAKDASLHERLNQSDMAVFKKGVDCLKKKDVEGAYQEFLKIKEKEAQDFLVMCALCRHKGEMELYGQFYQKALEMKVEYPERVIGDVFCDYLGEYEEAEKFYLQALDKGDLKANRSLGKLYAYYKDDLINAEIYLRAAIEIGDATSWKYLGDVYSDGFEDYDSAEEFYHNAINGGCTSAITKLGRMYQSKLKDFAKARDFYTKAIEHEDTLAMLYLAEIYRDNYKNYTDAEELYKKAIGMGEYEALRLLGWIYVNKLKDPAKAEEYYHRAIEKGETYTWNNIADLYRDEKKNYTKAKEYYLKAAEYGHNDALRLLGWMYAKKLKDPAKAEEYYHQAINKGETFAWIDLADLYRDKQKSYTKAEEYYLKAAEYGHTEALRLLGWMYAKKLKDPAKAEEYYNQAIEMGEMETWSYLAELYRDAYKDYTKAEEYYLKAVEEGFSDVLPLLGWMHANRLKDPIRAEEYYRQAIEKGEELAWGYLANLYRDMHEDYRKAENYYLKFRENNEMAGAEILGSFYEKLDKIELAEESFKELINRGENLGYNSLAWMYFQKKIKKADALKYAKIAFDKIPENSVAHTLACVLLWAGQSEKAQLLSSRFMYDTEYLEEIENDDEYLLWLILLLSKSQYPYLYTYFTSEKAEELHLKDRFKPIWYALMHYMREQYPTEYLRMPPELKETVQEIIAKVEQMRVDYA